MGYYVVIPAAGSGSRMGAEVPKVLLGLTEGGAAPVRSILQSCVDKFVHDDECRLVVVCTPAAWRDRFQEELSGREKVMVITGGASRQESVRVGVEAVHAAVEASTPSTETSSSESPVVLVHDAARCCVPSAVIRRVVEGVQRSGAVTAAIPVSDAMHRIADGEVGTLVDRADVWAIQTPQGFRLDELRMAHQMAARDGFVGLDDASVVARLRPVRVVEGDRLNIKVTHPHDLEVARQIDAMRR